MVGNFLELVFTKPAHKMALWIDLFYTNGFYGPFIGDECILELVFAKQSCKERCPRVLDYISLSKHRGAKSQEGEEQKQTKHHIKC